MSLDASRRRGSPAVRPKDIMRGHCPGRTCVALAGDETRPSGARNPCRESMRPFPAFAVLAVLLACSARAAPVDVDADILWDDKDAQAKCPALCSAKQLHWTGTWRKVGWTERPVCACDDRPPPSSTAAPHVSLSIGGSSAGSGSLPPGAVARYDHADFPGRDLRDQSAASFEQCAAMCIGATDCNAFTFAADQQRCYLKSGMSGPAPTSTASSGVVNRTGSAGSAPAAAPTAASGPSCSVGGTAKCPGCSVTCAPGQTPVCEHAVEGVTSGCARNTSCRCQ